MPGYQQPPPQPYRRPKRWPAVVGGLTVAAVVAAVVGVNVLSDSGPPHPDEWDTRVADLAGFVESARGLSFEHPVYVDFLTPTEYSARVRSDSGAIDEETQAEMDAGAAYMRALGLASGDVDLFEAGNDMVDSGTLAFYDPVEQRVSVRGTEMTVGLRVTLVHELTHALQDQKFDLEDMQAQVVAEATVDSTGVEGDVDGDATLAITESATGAGFAGFQALVEGDAVRIENAYITSLSPQEQDEYFAGYQEGLDEAQDDLGEVPNALLAFQAAPYLLGQPLVDLVAADGGNPAIDAMFDDLPTTEEHMLDPLSYIEREEPGGLGVPEVPDGGGEAVDQGIMGAVELFVVLGERIDPVVALDAADGWSNATYVSYDKDGRTCIRLLVDGETAQDDQQLVSAFASWAGSAPTGAGATAQATSTGAALVDTCDPGTAAAPINNRALDVISVAATRSQLSAMAVSGEIPSGASEAAGGWAIGNCFVHEMGFEGLVVANSAEVTSDAAFPPGVDEAITECMGAA